jgi:hypothetical protein
LSVVASAQEEARGEGGPQGEVPNEFLPLRLSFTIPVQSHSHEYYTGFTSDLRSRLIKHNAGEVPHTARWRPWEIQTAIAFRDCMLVLELGNKRP